MNFKGSVIVKKTHLLNMIENQKSIFRAPLIKDEAKNHCWGRQIAYETILEEDISIYNWDLFMQHHVFNYKPRSMSKGLELVFGKIQNSTPSTIEVEK